MVMQTNVANIESATRAPFINLKTGYLERPAEYFLRGMWNRIGGNSTPSGSFLVSGGALGTPSGGVLTNATGLPISTGLSGAGAGILTALGVNVGTAGAPVVNGGALGTPSSGVATNLTGTAAGLTAGNVTTNANLTGPITSIGNATAIASQTGTGSKIVVDTGPTIKQPLLVGVTDGSNAAAGNVGEYISSSITPPVNFPAAGTYGDATSIALTKGDWDVSMILSATLNGATASDVNFGIGTVAGNDATGLVEGDTMAEIPAPVTASDSSGSVPAVRVSLAANATYYAKVLANYTIGTPKYSCRISARRVR